MKEAGLRKDGKIETSRNNGKADSGKNKRICYSHVNRNFEITLKDIPAYHYFESAAISYLPVCSLLQGIHSLAIPLASALISDKWLAFFFK